MHAAHDGLAGIDLNLLVVLDAMLAERHVTRAARRLGLSQSAASHALGRLRATLDDPLLVRGPRGGLVATPLAERLAPDLRRLLSELAGTLRGNTFDPATARRTFHVGASDYVELVVLPQLTARLARLAPHIDLFVRTFTQSTDEALANGSLDLVIGPRRNPGLGATYDKRLFDETFTCLLAPRHPLARSRLTLARYCDQAHLLVAPGGTPGSLIDDTLAAAGHRRRIALTVPHFLVVPFIVAETHLVATLASRVARLFARKLSLIVKPPPFSAPRFTVSLAWHERTQHDPAHRWLRQTIVDLAAELRAAA